MAVTGIQIFLQSEVSDTLHQELLATQVWPAITETGFSKFTQNARGQKYNDSSPLRPFVSRVLVDLS